MKVVMVCGGMLLALCGGRLWWRAKGVATDRCPALSCTPLLPCTYTYKEVTYSLN